MTNPLTLHHGDCLDVLRTVPSCSVDAVVTDPPAGISFMSRAWDGDKGGRDLWIAWLAERLAECLRVLKPGGHAVVWALPRTSGWTHRALEDAGFDVRDCVHHLFGSGFPKSLDVGKAIDKAAGAEREVVGVGSTHRDRPVTTAWDRSVDSVGSFTPGGSGMARPITAPATPAAQQWDGWGTALKPAVEHWWLARKPLDSTVAGTVTRWGTGALNIDGCRVGISPDEKLTGYWDQSYWDTRKETQGSAAPGGTMNLHGCSTPAELRMLAECGAVTPDGRDARTCLARWEAQQQTPSDPSRGRWPADCVLSHNPTCDGVCSPGCAVAELDQQSGVTSSGVGGTERLTALGCMNDDGWEPKSTVRGGHGDSGGASRFFATFKYQAKPSTREKNRWQGPPLMRWHGDGPPLMRWHKPANRHPTVKPVELMRWLVRLVTPPGGIVLDPFAGSGTTLVAATLEGFASIGVEESMEHVAYIEGRVRWTGAQAEQTTTLALRAEAQAEQTTLALWDP